MVEEDTLKRIPLVGLLAAIALLHTSTPSADIVAVRHVEGLVHGFLVLRSTEGSMLASGDLIQRAHGNGVTTRLVFQFKDGSTNDETAVFTQRGQFRLVSDRLIQKGAGFVRAVVMWIDAAA